MRQLSGGPVFRGKKFNQVFIFVGSVTNYLALNEAIAEVGEALIS